MGRQRTINDQNFWHSTQLINCTTEDKVALLHLLTGPVSNIIGVYCSGLMKPDTHLGENARQIEVSDDQTTPCLFR